MMGLAGKPNCWEVDSNGKIRMIMISRLIVTLVALGALSESPARGENWPSWRGPSNVGSSATAKPPIKWSEGDNISWKAALRGKGHASPIVWDDLVFVSSAEAFGPQKEAVYNPAPGAHDNFPVDREHRFLVSAYHAQTGDPRWEIEVARALPHEGGHYTGSLASHSPLTDGNRVYAFFGSQGLYALNLEGEIVWKRNFGRMDTRHAHGEGSSPALRNGILVVNWDHEGESQVFAIEAKTGEVLWKQAREENTSWSTPLIVAHKERFQVVISATKRVRSYDLETGDLVWECSGLARNVVASPVISDGVVIVGNSYDKRAMMAIELDGASGLINDTKNLLWSTTRMTPYVPSPLVYQGALYFLRHNQAVLSCLNPRTGEILRGPFRLGGLREIFASPVAADGRIYIVGRNGATLVLSHEAKPQVLALNSLEDQFSASPALVGEALYLRGEKYLYCIGRP